MHRGLEELEEGANVWVGGFRLGVDKKDLCTVLVLLGDLDAPLALDDYAQQQNANSIRIKA